MCVGIRVKEYLKDTGRTQIWLSKETGIPAPKLNLALCGKRKLTFEEYALICGALGVDTNKFIVPKTNPTRSA